MTILNTTLAWSIHRCHIHASIYMYDHRLCVHVHSTKHTNYPVPCLEHATTHKYNVTCMLPYTPDISYINWLITLRILYALSICIPRVVIKETSKCKLKECMIGILSILQGPIFMVIPIGEKFLGINRVKIWGVRWIKYRWLVECWLLP